MPFIPSIYRIFMAGIVPSYERDPEWLVDTVQSLRNVVPDEMGKLKDALEPGNQIGPYFYAPALTAGNNNNN
jgi:hypothetical protein